MSDFNMMNASHSMSKSLCWLPSSPTRTGKHTHTSLWWELAVPTVTHRKQEWKEKGSLLWVPNISFSLNTGCLLKIHPELPCPRLIEPRSSHHTQSQESKIKKKKKKRSRLQAFLSTADFWFKTLKPQLDFTCSGCLSTLGMWRFIYLKNSTELWKPRPLAWIEWWPELMFGNTVNL